MATAISQFRNNIMADVPGCPIPVVDKAVVRAIRRFCDDTYYLRKTIEALGVSDATFPLSFPYIFAAATSGDFYTATISFANYTILDNYEPIVPIFFAIDGSDCTLQEFDMDNEVKSLMSIVPGKKKFYRFPDTTSIEIFPFLAGDASMDLLVTLAVRPEEGATSVDDKLYTVINEPVEALALYYLQKMPKRPWSDPNMAMLNKSIYDQRCGYHRAQIAVGAVFGNQIAQGGYF